MKRIGSDLLYYSVIMGVGVLGASAIGLMLVSLLGMKAGKR